MTEAISASKPNPNQEFEIRLTFPIYPEPNVLRGVLENLENVVSKGEVGLEDSDVFENILGDLFEREAFNGRCVEIYYPDFPPDFQYSPTVIDGLPGIGLVITAKIPARNFVNGRNFPTTPAEARECFINDVIEGEMNNTYDIACAWEMGPE